MQRYRCVQVQRYNVRQHKTAGCTRPHRAPHVSCLGARRCASWLRVSSRQMPRGNERMAEVRCSKGEGVPQPQDIEQRACNTRAGRKATRIAKGHHIVLWAALLATRGTARTAWPCVRRARHPSLNDSSVWHWQRYIDEQSCTVLSGRSQCSCQCMMLYKSHVCHASIAHTRVGVTPAFAQCP